MILIKISIPYDYEEVEGVFSVDFEAPVHSYFGKAVRYVGPFWSSFQHFYATWGPTLSQGWKKK